MESNEQASYLNRVVLVVVLLAGFLFYRGCQQELQLAASSGVVTPSARVATTPASVTQRLLAAPAPPVAPQNIYYVINQDRLYCAAITPDLQYTGTPAMRAWWATLDPKMQQWYFHSCQTLPPPN